MNARAPDRQPRAVSQIRALALLIFCAILVLFWKVYPAPSSESVPFPSLRAHPGTPQCWLGNRGILALVRRGSSLKVELLKPQMQRGTVLEGLTRSINNSVGTNSRPGITLRAHPFEERILVSVTESNRSRWFLWSPEEQSPVLHPSRFQSHVPYVFTDWSGWMELAGGKGGALAAAVHSSWLGETPPTELALPSGFPLGFDYQMRFLVVPNPDTATDHLEVLAVSVLSQEVDTQKRSVTLPSKSTLTGASVSPDGERVLLQLQTSSASDGWLDYVVNLRDYRGVQLPDLRRVLARSDRLLWQPDGTRLCVIKSDEVLLVPIPTE